MLSIELNRGRSRRESDGVVVEELGFTAHLWNGISDEEEGMLMDISCGAFPPTELLRAPNSVEIRFPLSGPLAKRLLCDEMLAKVVHAVVESWKPDWCRVTSNRVLEILMEDDGERPTFLVGWLTYLSRRYGQLTNLPVGYRTMELNGHGTLIVIEGSQRFSASNGKYIDAARRLADILNRAGMLAWAPASAAT